ncbi:helix-turn-helix domain-containing protein [Devosia neptuniae]|uniref:Helix-turn-helix domain-containing protein n=1 Tax=Devosia neptuniae TaxID=191302 RepID=A0ABY6CIQ5_9HYPH|nr:helix-turn-helix transcriptional regulator [Devosia neptuniae]UXN69928.1 helix-turn-helix domain-containing protein [Devosia neptuniae]
MHRLRVVRQERGLTVKNLAKEVGVSSATISRIEHNKQDPSLDLVRKLCTLFKHDGLAAHDFVNIEHAV